MYSPVDGGFVELVDHMGSDESIVRAARVSYGQGTKPIHDGRGLLRYLMRHRHTSPFEMVEFVFQVRCPIFVARQWMRHRTGSFNEISGRYSEIPESYYVPYVMRSQSKVNKQGSGDAIQDGALAYMARDSLSDSFDVYDRLLKAGVSREQARVVLPLATHTEFVWKVDLHNLLHFLNLRLDPHAQEEIRLFAKAILGMIRKVVPLSVEAWEDYVLNAVTFSAKECASLRYLLDNPSKLDNVFDGLSDREAKEFVEKINLIRYGENNV